MMYNTCISCILTQRYRSIPKTTADHRSLSLMPLLLHSNEWEMNIKFPLGFSQLRGFHGHGKNRLKHWMCCRELSICREGLVVPHLTSNKYYFLIQWLLDKKLLWVKSWRRAFFVLGYNLYFFSRFFVLFWGDEPVATLWELWAIRLINPHWSIWLFHPYILYPPPPFPL